MSSAAPIRRALIRVARARAALESTVRTVQKRCKHKDIAECDYKPSGVLFDAEPPIRVCLVCGISEEGWGVGFKVLCDERPRRISRDDIYRERIGLFIRDAHKTALIRKEKTLAQLIDGGD